MTGRFEKLLSSLLTLAALVIAATFARREFFPRQRSSEADARRTRVQYVDEWENLLAAGTPIGNGDAPVKVIEFTDLECPFCRQFHSEFKVLRSEFDDKVVLFIVHFPLATRFANIAARAAECARAESRFPSFVDLVFQKQDSVGVKSWTSFAAEAGVKNLPGFRRCVADNNTVQGIENGVQAGRRIGVTGTPTVIVNGWRFAASPSDTLFSRVVKDLLAQKAPFERANSRGRR